MGYRMGKFQGIGVEGHSFYFGIFRIIEIVPQKRRAQIFHMDPDLVGPAGFQRKAGERTAFPGTEGFVMGHGFFPFFKVHTAQDGRIFFPGNGRIYSAFGRNGRSPGNSQIGPADFPLFHTGRKEGSTVGIFSQDKKTCSIPVQTVDTPEDKRRSFLLKIPGDSVGQGVFVVMDRRMDGSIRRLIYHKDIRIFIENIQIHRNRQDFFRGLFLL